MVPAARPGLAALPPSLGPDSDTRTLERLLHDLRRRSPSCVCAEGVESLRAAAEALAAEAVAVWLLDGAGALATAVRYAARELVPPPRPPDLAAVRDAEVGQATRDEHGASFLDSGIWVQGELAGVLTARRVGSTGWSPAERAFLRGLADAAAADVVAERARRARVELDGIFHALPDLYFRLDAEHRFLDYRAGRAQALYAPPEAFLGKRMRDVLPPALCDRFEAAFAAASPDAVGSLEYALPLPDGTREFEARFVSLGDGTHLCVVRDVTERAAAVRTLGEREAELREAQRMARLGSWRWELASGELSWDPMLCELYGVAPEAAPRHISEYLALVHPDDRAMARAAAERALATGEPFAFDHRVLTPDGTVRYLHGRGSVVLDGEGCPARMMGTSHDVTERKEAERVLGEREAHFRRLIENTSDIVTFLDAVGRIRYQSPSLARMLGYADGELDGQSPFDYVHPDDLPSTQVEFAMLVAEPGSSRRATYRFRHKDGSWRVLESTGRTIREDSAADGIVITSRDVTERTQAAVALARAKEEAEAANRAKSEFLSRMSHELRTPLNSILGFGQLLARAELPVPQARGVQHILKAGRHLLNLINEVLEIARIESGRDNFSLEPVALAPVLQEALGLVRPLAQQWDVSLADGEWPAEAFVQADRQRLVQVLLNLLSNAIKYNHPRGRVRLTCTAEGGGWAVRVTDTGRGIPAERAEQLFTPFARLGAENSEVEGTGLGLALSRRLCEAMGGGLTLERSGPDGSVFRVDLVAAADPLRELEATGTHPVSVGPHREATLLYVEDNLANLSLVEAILLSRPGWRTVAALQGQLGVELAREHLPDLVLLDLHLPDIPGEEVLRRLRADARTAGIPVVVVSADATPASLERLRVAGADAYLTKPLDVGEFLEVVDRFLPDGARPRDG